MPVLVWPSNTLFCCYLFCHMLLNFLCCFSALNSCLVPLFCAPPLFSLLFCLSSHLCLRFPPRGDNGSCLLFLLVASWSFVLVPFCMQAQHNMCPQHISINRSTLLWALYNIWLLSPSQLIKSCLQSAVTLLCLTAPFQFALLLQTVYIQAHTPYVFVLKLNFFSILGFRRRNI